ncbi:hypothetical protein C8Q80DRAFT_817362 [Daedaleopsis nitida]|nr:hypothetical protein C8Q80DRAFT_817362 [Daedaleopsis nitida]
MSALPTGLTVPDHLGLSLSLFSGVTATAGLYAMTIMQIYMYFLNQSHQRDKRIIKLLILYLWCIETAQFVVASRGSWVLVAQYWRPRPALSTEFLWTRFLTFMAMAPVQLYFAGHVQQLFRSASLWKKYGAVPMILALCSLMQLSSYTAILVLGLRGKHDLVALSKAIWSVSAMENLVITSVLVWFNSRQMSLGTTPCTSIGGVLSCVSFYLCDNGILHAMCTVGALVGVTAASDLEVYSCFAMILCPLSFSMLLAHLNGRSTSRRKSGLPVNINITSMQFRDPQNATTGTQDTALRFDSEQSTKVMNISRENML